MNKTEIRAYLLDLYAKNLDAYGDKGDAFHDGWNAAIKHIAVSLGYGPQIEAIYKEWQARQQAVPA